MCERSCLECKHLYICDGGSSLFSEYTPPEPFEMYCQLGHFEEDPFYSEDLEKDKQDILSKAIECKDFKLDKNKK